MRQLTMNTMLLSATFAALTALLTAADGAPGSPDPMQAIPDHLATVDGKLEALRTAPPEGTANGLATRQDVRKQDPVAFAPSQSGRHARNRSQERALMGGMTSRRTTARMSCREVIVSGANSTHPTKGFSASFRVDERTRESC